MVKKFQKEIKFVLVGGVNTLLDFAVFNILASVFSVDHLIANICSTSICIAISFVLNSKYVWKSQKKMRSTAPGFLAVSLFSAWAVQSAAIKGVLALFGDGALISAVAKLCASACGMLTNYFGYKVVFSVDFSRLFSGAGKK